MFTVAYPSYNNLVKLMSTHRVLYKILIQESPRLDEITIVSRVIKKFGERGGRPVIFLLRTKYFFRAIDFVLGDKKTKIYMPLIDLSVR